jgi:hypothetical protein
MGQCIRANVMRCRKTSICSSAWILMETTLVLRISKMFRKTEWRCAIILRLASFDLFHDFIDDSIELSKHHSAPLRYRELDHSGPSNGLRQPTARTRCLLMLLRAGQWHKHIYFSDALYFRIWLRRVRGSHQRRPYCLFRSIGGLGSCLTRFSILSLC